MVKKIRCNVDSDDWVRSRVPLGGDNIILENQDGRDIYLTPADARKLRKQIKKALDAIERVDERKKNPEPSSCPDWLHEGAIVEITGNTNAHGFEIGEKVRVRQERLSEGAAVMCEYLDGHDYWWVKPSDRKPA